MDLTLELSCEGGGLPKKADLVNFFNDLSNIPSQITSYVEDAKLDLAAKGEEIETQVRDLEKQIKNAPEDAKAELQSQIQALESFDLGTEIYDEVMDTVEDVEETIETIADLFAPWWSKGNVRDWEKEAEDAMTELIQEYHIFIPVKMMEMISKIIPVEFEVPILGLQIDVLKIFDPTYQDELKKQIAGITDQYTAAMDQLQADFESGKLEQDAYDSARGMLEDEANKILDTFYMLVPEEYRYFDAEFGVVCNEYKAKLTWSYIKNEIMEWCTNTLFKLFDTLIGKFKEIWDALGLPDLPIPLSFDVAEWIRALIDLAKEKMYKEIGRIEQQVEDLEKKAQELEEFAEQLKEDIENFDATEELGKVKDEFVEELMDLAIPLPAPFDIKLSEILGGEIDKTVQSIEDHVHQLVTAARDWKTITMKELFNIWLRKIKKFLDAIGLGKLLDLLDLTLCDVMQLIGLPISFGLALPDIIDGIVDIPEGVDELKHTGPPELPNLDDIKAPDTENMTPEEFEEFIGGLI